LSIWLRGYDEEVDGIILGLFWDYFGIIFREIKKLRFPGKFTINKAGSQW